MFLPENKDHKAQDAVDKEQRAGQPPLSTSRALRNIDVLAAHSGVVAVSRDAVGPCVECIDQSEDHQQEAGVEDGVEGRIAARAKSGDE